MTRGHSTGARDAAQHATLTQVPIDRIDLPGRPGRRQLGDIAALAQSLHDYGLQQPISVRAVGDRYALTAGLRRLTAAKTLRWTTITAFVHSVNADDAYLLDLLEDLQHEALSPDEEASAFGELIRTRGWTVQQVAESVKRSVAYVSRRVRLFDDPLLRAAIAERGLPLSAAEELLAAPLDQRKTLIERALAEHWDAVHARAAVRAAAGNEEVDATSPADRDDSAGGARRAIAPDSPAPRRPVSFSQAIRQFHQMVQQTGSHELSEAERAGLRSLFRDLVLLSRTPASPLARPTPFVSLPAAAPRSGAQATAPPERRTSAEVDLSAEAEALDRLLDQLQRQTPGRGIPDGDVDPDIAELVHTLHLMATDTRIPRDLVQQIEHRIAQQVVRSSESARGPRAFPRQAPVLSSIIDTSSEASEPPETHVPPPPAVAAAAGGIPPRRSAPVARYGDAGERLPDVLAALRVPVLITSMAGRVTGFNAAATTLLGGPARLYGRSIRELLPFVPHLGDAAAPIDAHGRIANATGSPVDLQVNRTVLVDDQGHEYAVYVIQDVSQHAEVNRRREQVLSTAAHELRGPLTVLDNALEILATSYAELAAEEFAQLLNQAQRTTGRLRTLMDDLLSAGTIESGRLAVTPRPTPLSGIVDAARDAVAASTAARHQRVEVSLGPEELWVQADRRRAHQVLTNVLMNAARYSPAGSLIRISAHRVGGTVTTDVADEGPGIGPEHLPHVFERFYRVRIGDEEPGFGLGLAIAKSIIAAHGGQMGLDSSVGSGTRVWFSLPVAERGPADSPGG